MVTSGAKQNRVKVKNTRKKEFEIKLTVQRMVFAGIAVAILFAVVNAGYYYLTNEIHPTATYVSTEHLDRAIFAEVKPSPLITELSNVNNDSKQATIEFGASNVNATYKVKNFECSIDAGPWKACKSPLTLDLEKYDDSEHTLEIRVIDTQNGTENQPLAHIFK